MRAKAQWEEDQEEDIEWQRETDALNKQRDQYDDVQRTAVTRSFLTRTLEVVMPGVMKALRDYTDRRVRELRDEMESKLGGLPHEAGVYERGKAYRKGAITTHAGSAFIARCDASAPIGGDSSSPDWRLLVQHGRDAR